MEALKAKERNEEAAKRRKEEDQTTLVEQVKRVKEIEAIESDSFVQQHSDWQKEIKKSVEAGEVKLLQQPHQDRHQWCLIHPVLRRK